MPDVPTDPPRSAAGAPAGVPAPPPVEASAVPLPLPGAPEARRGVGRVAPRRSRAPGPDGERALAENAAAMFGSARRVSLCEDDAHDAVQAAAERFLKHRARVDPETVTGWLVTVARNEALRVRERRIRTGAIDDDDHRLVHGGDGPDDLAVREEEVALAREALARLKPQERLALWMQAEGRSYDEIAEELSWTRTKVNRSITEGRASLRKSLVGIATGEGCAIAGPRIDRLAAGGASAEDLRALRPHLRRCAGCRGRLRRARGARWGVMPPLLVAWLPWAGRGGTVVPPTGRTRIAEAVAERLSTVLPATTGAVGEAGLALTTGLAVVALGAGVVTGGVAGRDDDRDAREAERRSPGRTAAARPRTTPAAALLATAGTTLRATAVSWAAERRRAQEAARRAAARRDRARAAERRKAAAAKRRRAAARAAAGCAAELAAPRGAAAPPTTPVTPAAESSGGAQTGGARVRGAVPATSGGGAAGDGSAASEFGFE